MSKIGRKPIKLGTVQVELHGNSIKFKGKKNSGVYELPQDIKVELADNSIKLVPREKGLNINDIWGLHRALLSNKIRGADNAFERQLRIVGLGFKAVLAGGKLQFSLGFSHKIDFDLPKEISVEIDKTGQILTLKSTDKVLLGQTCSLIRNLRLPEPYKGTGIAYSNEVIKRKAGKAKAAA